MRGPSSWQLLEGLYEQKEEGRTVYERVEV